MEFDALLQRVGEFGKYQRWQYFSLCLVSIPMACIYLSIVFLGGVPNHRCRIPYFDRLSNISHEILLNISIPLEEEDGLQDYSQCKMYDRNYKNLTDDEILEIWSGANMSSAPIVDCTDGWWYDTSQFTSTVVMEWDMVCSRRFLLTISEAMSPIGCIFGYTVWGQIADSYGRRKVLLINIVVTLAVSLAVAFSPSIAVFCVLRFIQSFQAVWALAFLIGFEMSGPSKRFMVGLVIEFYWAAGFLVLAGVAYFVRDWFTLELIMTGLIVPFLIYFWITPESPRWLYSVHRHDEAKQVMVRLADVNGSKLPEDTDIIVKEEKPAKLHDLFRYPRMRFITIASMFISLVVDLVYYAISLGTPDLTGNLYLNFFASGAVEFPAYAISWVILLRTGRRWPFIISIIVSGIALLCVQAVPKELYQLEIFLAMFGKFAISMAFAIWYMYVAEVYPTCARSTGVGLSGMCMSIGNVVAPFVSDLSYFVGFKPLSNIILGVLSVVAGCTGFFMPETRGKFLPDSLTDAEQFWKRHHHRKKQKFANNNIKMTSSEDASAEADPMMNGPTSDVECTT